MSLSATHSSLSIHANGGFATLGARVMPDCRVQFLTSHLILGGAVPSFMRGIHDRSLACLCVPSRRGLCRAEGKSSNLQYLRRS